jgi:hypothetical protein
MAAMAVTGDVWVIAAIVLPRRVGRRNYPSEGRWIIRNRKQVAGTTAGVMPAGETATASRKAMAIVDVTEIESASHAVAASHLTPMCFVVPEDKVNVRRW